VYAKVISMEHFVMIQVSVQATLVSMVEYVEKRMQHLNVYVMKLSLEVIVKRNFAQRIHAVMVVNVL